MKKEHKESNKEITIIGIVREIEDNWKSCRVGIATENGSYVVRMNEEGKNLQYEIGNKVEATGIISRTKDGVRRIMVTGYEVYEKLSLFNAKLDILHLAIVLFKAFGDVREFGIERRHLLSHMCEVVGDANTGSHVLALSVDQEITFDLLFAGGSTACQGNTAGAIGSQVAEDHGLDVDRRTQIMGYARSIAVINRSFAVPAFKKRPRLRDSAAGMDRRENCGEYGV